MDILRLAGNGLCRGEGRAALTCRVARAIASLDEQTRFFDPRAHRAARGLRHAADAPGLGPAKKGATRAPREAARAPGAPAEERGPSASDRAIAAPAPTAARSAS